MKPGAYRRALRLAIEAGHAVAEMEDDIHHFRLTVRHDGAVVRGIETESLRTPWVTCSGAAAAMARLAGTPLTWPIPFASDAEQVSACTHMIDLVNLAIGRIGETGLRKRYDIEIATLDGGDVRAMLKDESGGAIDWRIVAGIVHGEPCEGLPLARLPAMTAGRPIVEQEPILALRRAVRIAGGRQVDLDATPTAGVLPVPATCYSLQPGIRERAFRNRGSTIDFWSEGRLPLGDHEGD